MTTHQMWQLFTVTCATVTVVWALANALALPPFRVPGMRQLKAELRPFAVVAIIGAHFGFVAATGTRSDPQELIGTALLMAAWFVYRDDDDDRWKRRRRKAWSRIKRTATGRLAVEPA